MTALDLAIGQKYVQKRGAPPDWRRVIELAGVGERFVQAFGWWEMRAGDGWSADGKQSPRRTRISMATLCAQYERLEET